MKTETKIAEENLWNLEDTRKDFEEGILAWKFACSSHKTTCQRFLEFMKDLKAVEGTTFNEKEKRMFEQLTSQKITDLKNAIKKYDENGI